VVQLKVSSQDRSGQIGQVSRGKRPPLLTVLLFSLLFSGPPSFRLRDPGDSLESIIDPSVVFQVSVWVVAGIWSLYQLRKEFRAGFPMALGLPDKLGLLMILFLGLSTFVSEAPLLTAFKVGQILVSLLFTWIFVYRYGIAKCIDYVFLGSVILCIAIAISVFVAPDLVIFLDKGEDIMRLHGDAIAPLPTVVTYSMILLFIKSRQISRLIFWPLLTFLFTMLAFSLTRQAWFLVLAFLLLYFARRSKGAFVPKLGFSFLVIFPFVFFFYILPALQEYRATDSIWSLTGRIDLWFYLVQVTLTRSAWTGLGYYSASRILGIDFNPGLGTAHSIFVEVLLGGGLLSLIPCLALCIWLTRRAFQFLSKDRTDLEFACGTLFIVTMIIGLLGGDFACGEVGITFWSLAAAIPAMQLRHSLSRREVSLPCHKKPSRVIGTSTLPADSGR
jgi:O-antigen ligase